MTFYRSSKNWVFANISWNSKRNSFTWDGSLRKLKWVIFFFFFFSKKDCLRLFPDRCLSKKFCSATDFLESKAQMMNILDSEWITIRKKDLLYLTRLTFSQIHWRLKISQTSIWKRRRNFKCFPKCYQVVDIKAKCLISKQVPTRK